MVHFSRVVSMVLVILMLLIGCAIKPVPREIDLPSQDIAQQASDENLVRVIFFNNTNKEWFVSDDGGRMNLWIDGKGVCMLNIGEYVVIETTPGEHTLDIEYMDDSLILYKHRHYVSAGKGDNYIQVYINGMGTGTDPILKPHRFDERFTAVKF